MRQLILVFLIAPSLLATNFNWVQTQSTTSSGGTAALSLAFSSNNTAGNAIIVEVSNWTGSSFSDSQGNTYRNVTSGGSGTRIFAAIHVKGGANTVTVHNCSTLIISEYSSTSTSYSVAPGLGTPGPFSGNPVQGNCFRSTTEVMAFIAAYDNGTGVSWTIASGNVRASVFEVGNQGVVFADNDVSSISSTYSNSLGPTTSWSTTATAFMYLTSGTTVCGTAPTNGAFPIVM